MKIEDINIDKDSVEHFYANIDTDALAESIKVSGGIDMSDNKLDNGFVPSLQKRLERIAENEFELFKQRREIERWLNGSVPVSLSDEEFKWLKAQHYALGEAMGALAKQRNVIKAMLDNPNIFDKHEASDTAKLIDKLKNEEFDVRHKIDKLDAFLSDDNKTAKVPEHQLELLKYQYKVMVEYQRTLMNRIFDLHAQQKW